MKQNGETVIPMMWLRSHSIPLTPTLSQPGEGVGAPAAARKRVLFPGPGTRHPAPAFNG
jgi:hypothetical protein